MSPHRIESLPSLAALPQYDISKNGFLPADPPLARLSHNNYQPWECIMDELPLLIESQRIREYIDILPVLSTCDLNSEAEWRRAHSMLAVMAQGYIWAGPLPSQRLPPAITIPFLQTSDHLEVFPVATYASLNLWNWKLVDNLADLTQPQNLVALHTATGTYDESWFFIISNAMEAQAGPLIETMLGAMEAVGRNAAQIVISALRYFTQSMHDIGRLLERMDEHCRPQIFYHLIRPFLAGSMNMEAAGLPRGVFFDEGNGQGSWRRYRGGSNGQSSLLQFCDAVLSVDHSRSGGFHAEMRQYMPGPHARFLDDVEAIANIRNYVESNQEDTELLTTFNEAASALSGFRDKHIALVTRYIIIPSRQPKPAFANKRQDITSASMDLAAAEPKTQALVGTGGTKLIPFLQTSRDETSETIVTQHDAFERP